MCSQKNLKTKHLIELCWVEIKLKINLSLKYIFLLWHSVSFPRVNIILHLHMCRWSCKGRFTLGSQEMRVLFFFHYTLFSVNYPPIKHLGLGASICVSPTQSHPPICRITALLFHKSIIFILAQQRFMFWIEKTNIFERIKMFFLFNVRMF